MVATHVRGSERNVIHVLPCNDLIEHEDEGFACVCGPHVEAVRDYGWLVSHHSLDRREASE